MKRDEFLEKVQEFEEQGHDVQVIEHIRHDGKVTRAICIGGGDCGDIPIPPSVTEADGFKVGELVCLNDKGLDVWKLGTPEEVKAQTKGVKIVDLSPMETFTTVELAPPFIGMFTTDMIEKI